MRNIIGVYGLLASGKTTFSKTLSSYINALYISADEIGHLALTSKKYDIVNAFGLRILDEDNNINRKTLGRIVFSDKKKLKKLESISHPFILDQIKKIIESTDKDIVIEAALLHRIKIDKLCNLKIYIDSKVSSIVSRLKNRSIDEDKARKLIKIQRDVKIKKSDADIVVKNMRDYKKLLVITKKIGLQYGSERLYKKQRRRQITYK